MRYMLISCLAVLLLASSCKKNSTAEKMVSPAYKAPLANAGEDTTILLPETYVLLDGSKSVDPGNRPITYVWKKLSGPRHIDLNDRTYQSSAPARIGVECYESGEGLFELTVTNDLGLSDRDTVKITVLHSTFMQHRFEQTFDYNSVCTAESLLPGAHVYDEANFQLQASGGGGLAYINQEYELSANGPYFYPPTLTVATYEGSLYFSFLTKLNFFTLPYNSGPATFVDSVVIDFGTGMFANISKKTRLSCSGIADTLNHTGKIVLQGSLFY